MQQIADSCGIAKGTLYKIFPSKDDLFIELFNECFEQFFKQAIISEVKSPLKKLSEEISYQINYFTTNRFMMLDYNELSIQTNPKFFEVLKTGRVRLLKWHEQCLLTAYGTIIEPYLGDLLLFLRGIVKSYQFFFVEHTVSVSIDDASAFIVQQLDAIISNLIEKQPNPAINYALLTEDEIANVKIRPFTEAVLEAFRDLHAAALSLEDMTQRDEASNVASVLLKEVGSNKPRIYIVRALLDYLAKIPPLKSLAQFAWALVCRLT
jgi:AcrR family transcriptional regulator